MSRTRSAFTTALSEDGSVAIVVDINGEVSVTNDAEAVVREVYNQHPGVERIVYRDSDRQWDELTFEVVGGQAVFRKFSSIDAELSRSLDLHAR